VSLHFAPITLEDANQRINISPSARRRDTLFEIASRIARSQVVLLNSIAASRAIGSVTFVD
jgi:hypothetical protein